jgi:hypothetical protein
MSWITPGHKVSATIYHTLPSRGHANNPLFYAISGGLEEVIRGSAIVIKVFQWHCGCRFAEENGAICPRTAVAIALCH